jgi:hypothetical protein
VERIFVQIAAYRDPEWQWTVKDLYDKARQPERIFVGSCVQLIASEDDHCRRVPSPRPEQCREVGFDARKSLGLGWARLQSASLWRGEEYTLQIDSHMRFVAGWDEKLIAMLALCPTAPAVLSTYAPGYQPPDKLAPAVTCVMRPREFDENGILRIYPVVRRTADMKGPEPHPYCSGHFLFGPSAIIEAVPHDPHIYFFGDEMMQSLRLWTNGFDIYAPNEVVLYHKYDRVGRRVHWQDHAQWLQRKLATARRIRHIVGDAGGDDQEALRDIDLYRLGSKRSLAEYERFAGIDFRRRLIGGKTPEELAIAWPPEERRARNAFVFGDIWRSGGWSSSEMTAEPALRAGLAGVLAELGIKDLADAGCGEANWIGEVSSALRYYFGFDNVDTVIDRARKRHGQSRGIFFAMADVTIDLLPPCDAILCRDVLTRYPLSVANAAFRLFKQSGARYLIATTHRRGTNDSAQIGHWHAISLTAPPFDFPPPRLLIAEAKDSAKALGVWSMADLPY